MDIDEAKQTFCLDLLFMFHKTGSCSTLYFCLVMQITSYKNKALAVYIMHTDFQGEFSGKRCVLYTDPLFSYEVIFSGRYNYMTISLCLFETIIKQLNI